MGSSESDNEEAPTGNRKAGAKKPKVAKAKSTGAKRGRKKRPKDAPKRPLSAYNIFFKEKREEITASLSATEIINLAEEKKGQKNIIKGVNLFKALAMIISKDWNTLPPDQKSVYEEKAKEEMAKYQVVLGEYRLKKEKEAESEAKARKEKEEAEAAAAAERSAKSNAAAAQQPSLGLPSGFSAAQYQGGMAGMGGPYGGFGAGALPGGMGNPYAAASAGFNQSSEHSARMGDPQHAALQQQQQLQHLMALQQLQQMNQLTPNSYGLGAIGGGDGGLTGGAGGYGASLGGNSSMGMMGDNRNIMALLQQQQANSSQLSGHPALSAMGGLPGQSYMAGLNQGALGGMAGGFGGGAATQGGNMGEEKSPESE